MASQFVIDAVEARLAAAWTRCPVVGFNTLGDTPADGSAFLAVSFPVALEEQISIGSPGSQLFRESGGFWLVLNVPRGQGTKQGGQWADELRTLFRSQQFGGVNCLGASPPYQDSDAENGNYLRVSVVVEYYADIIG